VEKVGKLMRKVKAYWRFFILLIKHGSLKTKRIDYAQNRWNHLKDLPKEILPQKRTNEENTFTRIKTLLLEFHLTRPFVTNFAFIKNYKKSYTKLFIDEDSRLIYLRIFKCGSTSILKDLLPKIHKPLNNFSITDKQIDALADYFEINKLKRNYDNYRSFTIVRDPLERVVSAYLDIFERGNYDDFLFSVFKEGIRFKEMLFILKDIPDYLRGPHLASQTTIIRSAGVKNLEIFKLTGDDRLRPFLNRYKLSIAHLNKFSKPYNYLNYYDSETLSLVHSIYSDDFYTLGFHENFLKIYNSIKTN